MKKPNKWQNAAQGLIEACHATLEHIRPEFEDEEFEKREGPAHRLHDLIVDALNKWHEQG